MRVIVVQRSDVLAQCLQPRFYLGRQPIGGQCQNEWHDPGDPEEAVADLRSEIAVMADAAQDDPEVGFPYRPAPAQRRCRSGAKQPVREGVELTGAAFERVGQPIDNRLEELGEDPCTGNARTVRRDCAVGEARNRGQLGKAHRDQPIASHDEPDRGRQSADRLRLDKSMARSDRVPHRGRAIGWSSRFR